MKELVVGPQRGYYIAIYAAPSVDGRGFTSYYKVCGREPEDYWTGMALIKGSAGDGFRTADEAIDQAEFEARFQVGNLPEASTMNAVRENRSFYALELRWLSALMLGRVATPAAAS